MSTLETERPTLRPLVAADAEAYAAMANHPEVAKWLPPAEGDPVAAARGTIGRFASSWQQRRYAPWGDRSRRAELHARPRDLEAR